MLRNLVILVVAAIVIALPFIFRQSGPSTDWEPGDPVLVIITPMNEAIRYEFARGFSDWHKERYGSPAKIDWRAVGGTSEIMRYLGSQYISAVRAWWKELGNPWPPGAGDAMLDRKFNTRQRPDDMDQERWEQLRDLYIKYRETDDPEQFTIKVDMFFGGGEYEQNVAYRKGMSVPPWKPNEEPNDLFELPDGTTLIPKKISGETCRTPYLFGTVLSTFGICYNNDRLKDLGVTNPPTQWIDLTNPVYVGQVGVADPTKSGSISKAFEMIVQQQCYQAIHRSGFSNADIDKFEAAYASEKPPKGELPTDVPAEYQQAIKEGWLAGMRLIQLIGANARYFTDSASKVPIDVGQGDAAIGLAIDFYGRYQAQCSTAPDGTPRMAYITPVEGSSVGADPIGLLRGAEHRELAKRFIRYLLSEQGQQLWSYRPGTPGGPEKFALRRLPIRRDFYPSDNPIIEKGFLRHIPYAVDDLADPTIDPYSLSADFTYRPRWTASHFSVQRNLIKAMCLDSGEELQSAWKVILRNGGPSEQTEAMQLLARLPDQPEPVTWETAPTILKKYGKMECMRAWTDFFRRSYEEAARAAEGKS